MFNSMFGGGLEQAEREKHKKKNMTKNNHLQGQSHGDGLGIMSCLSHSVQMQFSKIQRTGIGLGFINNSIILFRNNATLYPWADIE